MPRSRTCHRFFRSLVGRYVGLVAGRLSPQRRDRARKPLPQRPFLIAQAAPAHRRCRAAGLALAAAAGAAPQLGAISGLASGNGTLSVAKSSAVGSAMVSKLKL